MSDSVVTTVPDAPDTALKLDLPVGIIRIISDSDTLEHLAQRGYRLIATYVDQERTSRYVQSGSNAGYIQTTEQIEYRPVRKFILWLHEGGSLIEMGEARDAERGKIRQLQGENYTLNDKLRGIEEKHQEELQGHARTLEDRDRTIARLTKSEQDAVTVMATTTKQLYKITDALKAVIRDEAVVFAMQAAIAGNSTETTKDLLINYFKMLHEIGATK